MTVSALVWRRLALSGAPLCWGPHHRGARNKDDLLKEGLSGILLHELVLGAPWNVSHVPADTVVTAEVGFMVRNGRGGGGSKCENESSESAKHDVV